MKKYIAGGLFALLFLSIGYALATMQQEDTVYVPAVADEPIHLPAGWDVQAFNNTGISYAIPDSYQGGERMISGNFSGHPDDLFPLTTIEYVDAPTVNDAVTILYGERNAETTVEYLRDKRHKVLYSYESTHPQFEERILTQQIYVVESEEGNRFAFFAGWEDMDLSNWEYLDLFLDNVTLQ